MSQTQQPYQQPNQPSGKPPIVRLSTWVNVVLVLILLATCGGAADNASGPDEGRIADEVVTQLQGDSGFNGSSAASASSEIEDLCRLLGAIAAREKISPTGVMSPEAMTRCHEVAQEAATRTTP